MAQRNFLNRIKRYFYLSVSVIVLQGACAFGYVMPEDQILDFMCSNFKKVRTLSIIRSTLQTSGTNERVFTEQIWLESPDRFSVKALDRMGNRDVISPDLLYGQLFVMNSRERIESLLLSIGVDTSQTSYTRLNGVISFMIGAKGAFNPKLIVEKERFLPLLISYRLPGEDVTVTVTFMDYHKTVSGWHPFEIIYKKGDSLTEKYTVQSIEENVPVNAMPMSKNTEYNAPQKAEPDKVIPEPSTENSETATEHLKDVLKTYEEQYR
jgi:hypothetical protein